MRNKLSTMMSRLLGRAPTGPIRTPRKPAPFRPALQSLEDRLVPATIVVTTLADVVNNADHVVSLREAINQANATPGPDTIRLQAGVYKISLAGADDTNVAGDFDITQSLTV